MAAVNTESSTLLKAKTLSVPNSLNKTSPKASLKSCGKFEKRPCSEISFKDFLDFLRTAYQINEAIEGVPDDLVDKVEIDWQDIGMNEFVSSLLAVKEDSSIFKAVLEETTSVNKTEDQNIYPLKQSSSISDSGDCREDDLDKIKEESSEICSEISKHKTESDCSVSKVDGDAKQESKIVPKGGMSLEVKRHSNQIVVEPPRKLHISAKIAETKRKMSLNKKDSSDCKDKKSNEDSTKNIEHLMKRKLNEVIQEGLLDSVLPYVVPKQSAVHPAAKKLTSCDTKKPPTLNSMEKSLSSQSSKDKLAANNRRKSSSGEVEVEIHVCDEVKNLKRDFRCPQKLLVSKMGYFAEVTTGQKLEDMDISVHCDITIFDWLMRWVKRDSVSAETWPKLDAGNVVPILVSAAFLQMDPLLQDCLEFCRRNMNEIAKTSTNLACLNDSILTRLANLFSNSDVEGLRDKKDKIQSRLYCKLILALTETSPEPARGHFASLASIYKCGRCDKLVLRQLGGLIPCKPCNMRLDHFGTVHGNHIRDSSWNLNDYICSLRQELKAWRQVYWRLWGDCHFLYCSICHNYFPMHQMQWCCHHPEPPQFFTMEHQRAMTFPIGRYPCCGERAYRFEVLNNQSGCQFKEHTPVLNSPRDVEVHKLFMKHQHLLSLEPPTLQFPERLTRLVSNRDPTRNENISKEVLWWEGIELAPPRPRQGLLAKIWESHQKKEQQKKLATTSRNNSSASSGTNSVVNKPVTTPTVRPPPKKQMSVVEVNSNGGNSTGNADADNSSSSDSSSSSATTSSTESEDNSEESAHAPVRRVTAKPRRNEVHHYFLPNKNRELQNQWEPKLSVRNNQDNQREYEERAVRQMAALLTRRTCADSSSLYARTHNRSHGHHGHSIWNNHIIPQGGIYVRLEHEWREANCHSHGCPGNSNRQRSIGWGSSRPRVRTTR
ncbi:SANT and BTB domain regulator of class switch recombination [Periplaneta americana]|uniref:SANT and BTB domain regulator of class switch recombination n=1 Tax=Periplaneta americana TaxID=6978 RepID=UPI0037E7F824